MNKDPKNGPKGRDAQRGQPGYKNEPDTTPRREGGDDALAESSPADPRLDEKVIVNEQRSDQVVNAPSGNPATNSSEEVL